MGSPELQQRRLHAADGKNIEHRLTAPRHRYGLYRRAVGKRLTIEFHIELQRSDRQLRIVRIAHLEFQQKMLSGKTEPFQLDIRQADFRTRH